MHWNQARALTLEAISMIPASLVSWRPTYAAVIMLLQNTQGEEGLTMFSTNFVAILIENLPG